MSKLIFIPSLSKGGAEKVAVNLLRSLDFDYLLVLDDRDIAYPVPRERLFSLRSPSSKSLIKKMLNFPIRYFRLREFKKKYKVSLCLSLLEPPNLLNVLTRGKEKTVLSFRSNYSIDFSESPFWESGFKRKLITFAYRFFMKHFYSRADLMVAVSKSAKEDLVRNFGLAPEKLIVIYNPIYLNEINLKIKEPLGEYEGIFNYPVIINVGRLTKQKGQWYLLRLFKELKVNSPALKLLILGDGELKGYLAKLSENLGLRTYLWDRDNLSKGFDVYFLGFQKNPFKFISKSTLFLFPSLWEGLPNALVEALACGLPVISSDCKSGPREILAPDTDFMYQTRVPEFAKYGVLMPVFDGRFKDTNEPLDEVEKMWVEVISKLLTDEDLRNRYTEMGKKRAKDFDIEVIAKEWKKILEGCLNGGF